jgi:hypothetical protein
VTNAMVQGSSPEDLSIGRHVPSVGENGLLIKERNDYR